MTTPLSFYDHHRQPYAANLPIRHEGEFMIGGYVGDAGVDKRGEFMIVLHRFGDESYLTPQLRVFNDAFGALREAIAAGLLDALESVIITSRDDLAATLEDLGFHDRSAMPRARA